MYGIVPGTKKNGINTVFMLEGLHDTQIHPDVDTHVQEI